MLRSIPGVQQRTAELMIAEIGVDMGRFGSSARLASWAGMCPGNNESGGKHRSGKTRKGSKWLRSALTESARAAARSKGTYLSAQYYRLKGRRGANKWLRSALTESARAAARSKGTYLSAQYYRLKGRRGANKATVAVGHSILVAAYHILDRGVPYEDLGADYFLHRHDPERHANKLVRQLRALGYEVKIEPVEAA